MVTKARYVDGNVVVLLNGELLTIDNDQEVQPILHRLKNKERLRLVLKEDTLDARSTLEWYVGEFQKAGFKKGETIEYTDYGAVHIDIKKQNEMAAAAAQNLSLIHI